MGSSKGGGSSVKIPKPPPIGKSYQQGIDVYLKNLPQMLQGEQQARGQYDPQRVAEQQGLQSEFGPNQYKQQLAALQQLDPGYMTARGQLANRVVAGLNQGAGLDPGSATQLQQQVRGAQAARGNIYGDAPAVAEAYTLGDRGQQLYQQRLQNAAGFLGMPTIATQVGQVAPISADRTAAYVDPNAGFQGVNAQNSLYGAQASLAAAQQGQRSSAASGWGSTIGGVVGGVAGAYFGGPVGAQAGYGIGSGLGGQVGSSFSDRRLKKDVRQEGIAANGAGIYSFAYRGHGGNAPRHVGFMADEVRKVDPGAVSTDPATGYLKVSNEYAPVRIE